MTYLLDTDTCVFLLRRVTAVTERLLTLSPTAVRVSVVTVGELHVGAEKSAHPAANLSQITAFLAPIAIVPVEAEDARVYGRVRASLERAGTKIGPLDTWIAAQAVARDLVVVSNNVKEFRRVRGLRVESWKS